jgi:S1-C subfamily serine protease
MHLSSQRSSRRAAGPIAVVLFIAIAVGACSSAITGEKTVGYSGAAPAATVTASPAALVPVALPVATPNPIVASSDTTTAALALQTQMVAVIKAVTPSVVQIETESGLGSGIVYDGKGNIITNAHVVGTATSFQVTLSDGKTYPATLVGSYAPDDIAVIHVAASGLVPATFGDSSKLSVGDFVLALGNPLGLQSSVTEGIVSAVGRQVSEPSGNALPDVIQTSAAINPGNSGGALVDLLGNVVGIPTLSAGSQSGGVAGIGFAISSNRARVIADQLITGGKVTSTGRAYMGVQLRDGTSGPTVVAVVAGGPAKTAGIVVGDVILSIDGKATPNSSTLIEATAAHHPGDTVQLSIRHQTGTTATVNLILGQLPG